jgi:hypothetical protein
VVAIDALRGRMVAGKVDGFFDDPRSLDLLDADQVDLFMSSAPVLVDNLLANQVPWVVRLLARHPAVRSLLMADHLPEMIGFLDGRPDVMAEVVQRHPDWTTEMRARFLELSVVDRKALTTEYGATLQALRLLSTADESGS